eukprot:1490914-Pyramimonas_sp.AAC.1
MSFDYDSLGKKNWKVRDFVNLEPNNNLGKVIGSKRSASAHLSGTPFFRHGLCVYALDMLNALQYDDEINLRAPLASRKRLPRPHPRQVVRLVRWHASWHAAQRVTLVL